MKKYLILALSLFAVMFVAGCEEARLAKGTIVEKARISSMILHQDAKFTLCDLAPVGTIRRIYDTQEKMDLYNSFCRAKEADLGIN